MNKENKLAAPDPVQTEFAWADASRVESALAEPNLAESAVTAVPVESALPEPSQPQVSDPTPDPRAPAPDAESATPAPAIPEPAPKRPFSERRLAANRANALKSTGPRTPEGKRRSALNATRHGILSQVLHLPEEEMAAYDEFTAPYVASLAPVGQTETELARACADLQFRLHRLSAAEHNLFALGHEEHGDRWDTGHPESHAAMTFVETLRCSKDPLATLSLYEQRLSRRFLQTLNKLHQMQKERKALEQEQLKQLYMMSLHHPEPETLEPSEFGFVCSSAEWKMFYKRIQLLTPPPKSPNGNTGYKNRSQSDRQLNRRAA
jgi:hypothetical protein